VASTKQIEVKTAKGRQAEFSKAQNFTTTYANSINVEVSNWDVRMRLGVIEGLDDNVLKVEEFAHVMMSHSHTRAFYKAMGEIIAKLDAFDSSGQIIEPQVNETAKEE